MIDRLLDLLARAIASVGRPEWLRPAVVAWAQDPALRPITRARFEAMDHVLMYGEEE